MSRRMTGGVAPSAVGNRQQAALLLARQSARAIGPDLTGGHPQAQERDELARAAIEARAALEAAASAAAAAAERAFSVAEALDEALARLAEAEGVPASDPPAIQEAADLLSPREREVLALVAEGRTNKAIADALFVSPNTIKTHVASLLYKLRVETRVQLAALAARHEQGRPPGLDLHGIKAAPG